MIAHSKQEAIALVCEKDSYSYGVIKSVDPVVVDFPWVFIDKSGD